MRTRFFALVAMVLGLASCQNDFDGGKIGASDEVTFRLAVGAPELVTRAGDKGADDGIAGYDSAYGAIDYLQAGNGADEYRVDWTEVDLRYIMEVYDVTDDYTGATPVKKRMVEIRDSYEPIVFDLRLIPNRNYHFVVFADFVDQGASNDPSIETQRELGRHHIVGATLADIAIKNDGINDECTDAYFATKDILIVNSIQQDIVLKRPYGKLRVVATDLADLNLNVNPKSVKVTYTVAHPATFNAVTGTIGAEDDTRTLEFGAEYIDNVRANMANNIYNAGYDAKAVVDADKQWRNSHMTLFTDYILGVDEHQTYVSFDMEVFDEQDVLIKKTEFSTLIPIQRNHLTTVIGNVLTTATSIEVSIDDNFANSDREYYVFEAFANGGVVDLDDNYVVGRTLFVENDAVLNLNGFTIKNSVENGDTDVIVVREGATLTINGEGVIEAVSGNDGYAIIVEGTLIINDGTYKSGVDANNEPNAVIYARNNGKVYVNGGTFPNESNSNFVLNKKDADRATTTIEVCGGKFYKFNPEDNAAEGAGTNFCADGFMAIADGDWYEVVAAKDYEMFDNYMAVYTAKGLAKYAYYINNLQSGDEKLNYGLQIMNNINMPQYEIVADAANETYVWDESKPITVTDGVPSGSNWVPLRQPVSVLADCYSGHIEGNNKTISGLRINSEADYTAFVGTMWDDGSVKNLVFDDAAIKGTGEFTCVVIARAHNGIITENVHVRGSKINGNYNTSGIVGYNFRRVGGAQGQGFAESFSIVRNCSVDKNTTIVGTGGTAGGVVAYNYGALVIECKSYADVTATSGVGGIVGYSRDYHHDTDGHIVACEVYADATITATAAKGSVGGIVGSTLADNNIRNTCMPIVACMSQATLSGYTAGCVVGRVTHKTKVYGSVAVKNGATKVIGSGGTVVSSYAYDANDICTADEVNALNDAIAEYNLTAPAEAKCNHTWTATTNLPKLN